MAKRVQHATVASNPQTPRLNDTHWNADHTLTDLASLSSGLVPNAELASSGTPDGTTFLRGDRVWAAASGGSTAMTKLDQTVLGSDAATIDFLSISGSYEHLFIMGLTRSDASATYGTNVSLRFNNNSSAIYTSHWKGFYGNTSVEGGADENTTAGNAFRIEGQGAGVPAATPSSFTIWIPSYARTVWNKIYHTSGGQGSIPTGGNNEYSFATGVWQSTAAITRITFLLPGSDKFKTGSVFTLYGYS